LRVCIATNGLFCTLVEARTPANAGGRPVLLGFTTRLPVPSKCVHAPASDLLHDRALGCRKRVCWVFRSLGSCGVGAPCWGDRGTSQLDQQTGSRQAQRSHRPRARRRVRRARLAIQASRADHGISGRAAGLVPPNPGKSDRTASVQRRYATTSQMLGARWPSARWGRCLL
jgi:hypothetical protein